MKETTMNYCGYQKSGKKGWISHCGLKVVAIGRSWIYCPKCGKVIKRWAD